MHASVMSLLTCPCRLDGVKAIGYGAAVVEMQFKVYQSLLVLCMRQRGDEKQDHKVTLSHHANDLPRVRMEDSGSFPIPPELSCMDARFSLTHLKLSKSRHPLAFIKYAITMHGDLAKAADRPHRFQTFKIRATENMDSQEPTWTIHSCSISRPFLRSFAVQNL